MTDGNITKKKTLTQRLFSVMEDMEGSPLAKQKKDGVPYQTLSHDTVSAAIRPLLIKHGVIGIPRIVAHKRIDDMTEATIEMTFLNVDDREDAYTASAFGYGYDKSDKGAGKAISYAVKYIYLKTFCLETTDDPENEHIERPRQAARHDQGGPPDDDYSLGGATCPLCDASDSVHIEPGKFGAGYHCDQCNKWLKKAEWSDAGMKDPKAIHAAWEAKKNA